MKKQPHRIDKRKQSQRVWIRSLFFDTLPQSFSVLFFLFGFFIPSQLGKHFFEPFSYISGVRVDYLAPTLYISDVLIVLLILTHRDAYKKSMKNIFVQSLLLLMAIHLTTSIGLPISLYRFFKLIEIIAVVGLFTQIPTSRIRPFIYGLGAAIITQSLLVVMQLVSHASLQGIWYLLGERAYSGSLPGIAKASLLGAELVRPYGTFSHPNSLAGFFAVTSALFMFFRMPIMPLALKRIFLILSSILVCVSLSLPAIVALFGIYSYLVVHKIRRTKSLQKYMSYTIVTLVAVFVFGISTVIQTKTSLSVDQRIILQSTALQILRDHPITGVGLGAYIYAASQYQTKTAFFLNQPVHNVFLLLLTELGVIVTAVTINLVWMIRRRLSFHVLSFSMIWIICITGLFDHYWLTLQQNNLILAVVLGLCLRADLVRYDSACEVGLPDHRYLDQS